MRYLLIALFFLITLATAQQQQPGITQGTLTAGDLSTYLLSLQPKDGAPAQYNLTVVASTLPSAFTTAFDALTHGWCQDPILLWCRPAHYPIPVTVITGESGKESFRVPATSQRLALPSALSGGAAEVWVVKDNPAQAIWLVRSSKPEQEAILIGGLLSGVGGSAQLTAAPGIATAMHRQLLLDAVKSRATRWQP